MSQQDKNLDYEELARIVHLYLNEWCDESLPYPNMCAGAVRSAKEAHEGLKKNSVPLNVVKDLIVVIRALRLSINSKLNLPNLDPCLARNMLLQTSLLCEAAIDRFDQWRQEPK